MCVNISYLRTVLQLCHLELNSGPRLMKTLKESQQLLCAKLYLLPLLRVIISLAAHTVTKHGQQCMLFLSPLRRLVQFQQSHFSTQSSGCKPPFGRTIQQRMWPPEFSQKQCAFTAMGPEATEHRLIQTITEQLHWNRG